jgi:uncharacterized protein (DUF983 family)
MRKWRFSICENLACEAGYRYTNDERLCKHCGLPLSNREVDDRRSVIAKTLFAHPVIAQWLVSVPLASAFVVYLLMYVEPSARWSTVGYLLFLAFSGFFMAWFIRMRFAPEITFGVTP